MKNATPILLCLCLSTAAFAQTPEQLKAIEQDLQQSTAERERIAKEGAALGRDLTAARQKTIDLAKEIQDQEYSILVIENRLADLEADAAKRSAALGRRDAQMRDTLFALERLALHPADALTLTPLAPEDAVRAAILLRAAVPAIGASANALQTELSSLYRLRSEITAQRQKIAAGAANLVAKRTRLEMVIAAKTDRQGTIVARDQDLGQRVDRLSREAEDLRALFAKLAEEKAKRDEAERKAAEARRVAEAEARAKAKQAAKEAAKEAAKGAGRTAAKPEKNLPDDPEKAKSALNDAAGRPFSKAKGTLPVPAIGKITARYGEAPPGGGNGGLLTKGLTILTQPGGTVVSPYDGVVAFAGPFRGYGELLIIEHSEGYHTLLAGMGRIDSTVGQRVLAGEPVGAMSGDAPSLYVELRRDGQPINPLPWLADRGGSGQLGQSGPDAGRSGRTPSPG